MPVPFEALLPYGVMLVMFSVAGGGLGYLRLADNGFKRPRYGIQEWDKVSVYRNFPNTRDGELTRPSETTVMERDQRLTGYKRGQTDNPTAPPGFEINKPWHVEFMGSPR